MLDDWLLLYSIELELQVGICELVYTGELLKSIKTGFSRPKERQGALALPTEEENGDAVLVKACSPEHIYPETERRRRFLSEPFGVLCPSYRRTADGVNRAVCNG